MFLTFALHPKTEGIKERFGGVGSGGNEYLSTQGRPDSETWNGDHAVWWEFISGSDHQQWR